ncbi:MAG TPA: sugar ABC transporter substrate-binding protein [Baekduia sp.]
MKHHPLGVGRTRLAAVLSCGLMAVGVAACGSSSDSSSSSSSGSSSAGTSAVVTKAKAAVAAAQKPWTTWDGPTASAKPPKDVNLAIVVCAGVVAGCVQPGQEAQKAAQSLGWKTKVYDGKGDPSVQSRVVTQAVNSGANAILLAGVDPAAIQDAMSAAKQAKIPVGDMTQGIAPSGGIAFDIGANYEKAGVLAGQWIVADSGGKATVLPTNDKEFASTHAIVDGAVSVLKQCASCSVKPADFFVASNIGNGLGQRIASDIQRDPKINYVIGAFDPAVSDMVPAIQNAGLGSRVKIISNVGLEQNLGFIRDGNVQAADVVFDNQYVGYAAVDQMIRTLTGAPLSKSSGETDPRYIYNENVPYHLVTKANVGDPKQPWHADIDTVARFDKLWGVGQ